MKTFMIQLKAYHLCENEIIITNNKLSLQNVYDFDFIKEIYIKFYNHNIDEINERKDVSFKYGDYNDTFNINITNDYQLIFDGYVPCNRTIASDFKLSILNSKQK